MIIKCPECGHQVSSLAVTCPSCGIAIAGNITKCPHCGGTMLANQDVCPNCLNSIHQRANSTVRTTDETEAPAASAAKENTQNRDATAAQEPQPAPRNHKGLWATLIVAFVIALAVVFLGYYFYRHTQEQNEQYAYENAIRSSEPAVLQNFLDIYVAAPKQHRDSIKAHLEVLRQVDQEWQKAVVKCSKVVFEKYIERHPTSIHTIEAKLKIDSLDWITAASANTLESYKTYMENHTDGSHFDDAKMNYDKLSERMISPADEQMVNQVFSDYFNSLARNDETGLMATLGTLLNSFMRKPNATPDDVARYMKSLHEATDITSMNFLLNNDWKIDKIENIETGEMEYAVTFTVNQYIDRTEPDKERKNLYKVSAKVSPEGKIVELNMKKVVR